MRFEVLVEVRLRPGIADPQGATIERALPALGFDGVDGVRVGKAIRFSVEAPDETAARARATEMSERLLANPVIEDAVIEVTSTGPASTAATGAGATGAGATSVGVHR